MYTCILLIAFLPVNRNLELKCEYFRLSALSAPGLSIIILLQDFRPVLINLGFIHKKQG